MNESHEKLLQEHEGSKLSFESPFVEKNQKWISKTPVSRITCGLLQLMLATSIIMAITSGITNTKRCHPPVEFHCGSSAEEAKTLGCKFDIMEFAWVHPACWDQQLLDEFAPPDRWLFASDEDFSSPITQEAAATGDIEALWVRTDYHGAHCTYCFYKLAKAVAERRPYNLRNRQLVHAHHCAESIHNLTSMTIISTARGGVNYLRCRSNYPNS